MGTNPKIIQIANIAPNFNGHFFIGLDELNKVWVAVASSSNNDEPYRWIPAIHTN
jgi:hypothetical protein